MIFTDRKITIRNGKSTINEPVILYRGDYEVSIKFTIMESKFIFKSGVNLVDSEKASFGQLAILAPYGGNVFSETVKCEDGTVTFTLTKEMIDQLEEVGLYSFQIRLFDYYRESRVSIPPVEFGIEVREPIAAEDHINAVDQAMVGYSIAKTSVLDEPVPETFNAGGQYNKTDWETGDRISEGKLNKIEDAIHQINQNELNDVSTLDKRVTNNFTVLDSTKANKDDVIYKGYGTLSDFNEETRRVLQGLEPGSINAVLGEGNVRNSNIADDAVSYEKIDWIDVTRINLCPPDNFIKDSLIWPHTGLIGANTGTMVSDYIKVTPGVTYSTNNNQYYFARYDQNKNVVFDESKHGQNFSSPWTCEEGVHFVRVTYNTNVNPMFNEGEIVLEYTEYKNANLKFDEVFSRSITKEVESRIVIPDNAVGYRQMDWVDIVSLNLCPDNFIKDSLIWPHTGLIGANTGTMVSDYIKVTPGVTYSTNTGHYFARYDENKNLVYDESKHGQNFSSPWTCEEGVHFVRVTYNTNVNPMFNEGEIVLEYTEYKNANLKFDEVFSRSITKEVESNLSNIQGNSIEDGSISPEKNTYVAKIENLFNPDAILRNTLVNGSGNPYTYEGATLTDFIPVEEGYSYQMFDGKQMYHSAFYDKNKKFVRYVSGGYYPPLVVPSGQNIGYVRLGFNSNYSLNTMVYKIPSNIVGTPEYVPFGETTYIFADDDAFIKAFKKVLNINDSLFRTNLPPQIELVEGDTFELFYDSILDVVKYSNYNLNFTGGNFSTSVYAYPRKIYYKSPSSTHTKAISLEWTDDRKNVVARADSNVVVYPKKNPSAMRNLLIIGDSLTDRQGTVKTLAEKMATNGFTNVRFIGTRNSGYDGAYHEGRSGWKISDYYSQPCYNGTDTSQPNPFWFDNECNFKKYCEANYFSGIDYAIIHLNWNDSWRNTDNMVNVKYNNLVQRLKRDYPNCKIILVSVPFRNALQYNTIWNSCTKEDIFNLNDAMQKYCESNENVHWVNTFMQCDSEYNTEMSDIQVNMRNTKTEMVCVDSVHPGILGYQQIADAYYRKLNYLFNLYE